MAELGEKISKEKESNMLYVYAATVVVILILAATGTFVYLENKSRMKTQKPIDEVLFNIINNKVSIITDNSCLFCTRSNSALEKLNPLDKTVYGLDIKTDLGRFAVQTFKIKTTSTLIVDTEILSPQGKLLAFSLKDKNAAYEIDFKDKKFLILPELGLEDKEINFEHLDRQKTTDLIFFCDPFQLPCLKAEDENISYNKFYVLPTYSASEEVEKYIYCSPNKEKEFYDAVSSKFKHNDFKGVIRFRIEQDVQTQTALKDFVIVDDLNFTIQMREVARGLGLNDDEVYNCVQNKGWLNKVKEAREKAREFMLTRVPGYFIANKYVYYGYENFKERTCMVFGNCAQVIYGR